MTDSLLPAIEFESAAQPSASVIVLHGLGADGKDFVPIVQQLQLPKTLAVRFIFPHAPVRRVTINGGYPIRAWYDIVDADLASRADLAGVREAQAHVEAFITNEIRRGIPASRIVLAGFSQGGAIALYAGLRRAEKLAGIVALSTYLIDGKSLQTVSQNAGITTPIFMAHGTEDPVVRFDWADASRRQLEVLGYAVEWWTYKMGHTVVGEEVERLGAFLRKALGAEAIESRKS